MFRHDPPAADMLSVMGMLDSQAIPKSLLPSDASTRTVAFEKALGTLQAFSLIAPRYGR